MYISSYHVASIFAVSKSMMLRQKWNRVDFYLQTMTYSLTRTIANILQCWVAWFARFELVCSALSCYSSYGTLFQNWEFDSPNNHKHPSKLHLNITLPDPPCITPSGRSSLFTPGCRSSLPSEVVELLFDVKLDRSGRRPHRIQCIRRSKAFSGNCPPHRKS